MSLRSSIGMISCALAMMSPRTDCSAQGVLPVHRYYSRNTNALTWDNTTGNSRIDNGSGNWNTSNSLWVAAPPAGANTGWVNGSNAIFGGNPGTGTAGTVAVKAGLTVRNVLFNPTNAGTFLLNGTSALTLQNSILTTQQDADINAPLAGSGNFVKRGPATLGLGGAGTLSGTMTVSDGTLQLNSTNGLGNAAVVLGDNSTGNNNISYVWAGGLTPANDITVAGLGTGTVTLGGYTAGTNTDYSGDLHLNRAIIIYDGTADRTTFSGLVSGTGDLTITGSGTYNSSAGMGARVTFENNANSFTGQLSVLTGKALQLSGTDVINNQAVRNDGWLVLNAGAGNTTTIGTLTGTGICELHAQVTGPQTLSLGNDNGGGTFSGTVRNAGTGSSQVMNLVKNGTGTQILSGTASYTGQTTANRGILSFSNTPASTTLNVAVSNIAPTTGNSGRITVPGSLAGKTVNIVITESGTGVSYQAVIGGGGFLTAPTLRVNGAALPFASSTTPGGTTVTYNSTNGIVTVSR